MAVSGGGCTRCAYYPVFLDMREKRAVVVGGGEVAARKVGGLVDAGARVRVVSPEAVERIELWAQEGVVELERRVYQAGDLAGAFLAYCATNDARVNEAVHAEAEERGIPVNVVDDPAHCSFIVASVVRRGALQIAVSTGGCAPTVAKRIRRELEECYPGDWEAYIDLLGEVRVLVKNRVSGEEADRAPYFEAACDPALLARLRAGEALDAESVFSEIDQALAPEQGMSARFASNEGGSR